MSAVSIDYTDTIAEIQISNPPGNKIGPELATQLLERFTELSARDVHILMIRGAGEHFCQGSEFSQWGGRSAGQIRAGIELFARVLDQLDRFSFPTIAVVQGECRSDGFQLALGCDLIVAGRGAQFSFPEEGLGLATVHGGIAQLADRMGKARAIEFVLLGSAVDAEEMERLNVVTRVVDDDRLLQEARALSARLVRGPANAFAVSKSLLRAWSIGGVPAARAVALELSMPLFEQVDARAGMEPEALGLRDDAAEPSAQASRR